MCLLSLITNIWMQYKKKLWQQKGALPIITSSAKKILMGGNEFVDNLSSKLQAKEGHQVFTILDMHFPC